MKRGDYEIRKNKGEDNWAKFLIGIEQKDENGELTAEAIGYLMKEAEKYE